jgi:enolase
MNIFKSSKIKSLKAREILDSRGNWTVEVDLVGESGLFRDSAPSGASKGKYEAKAVNTKTAVKNVNYIIAPKLKGKDVTDQKGIDGILKKLSVGANATTPVSEVCARASASAQKQPLWQYIANLVGTRSRPILSRPCFNIINGGVHAGNDLDFQEFMIVPQAKTFRKSLEVASEIYQKLRKKLGKNIGDEGGFAPPFRIPEQALELIKDIDIIIDAAASQFYTDGKYKMSCGVFTREGLIRYYQNLIKKYPIIGLEDPFAETDLESWKKFKPNILIIGDDLLVTNPQRIKTAKEKNLCNGLLLKINQIGTVTEALEAARLAKSFGWKIMVSHRSGETNDDFIADFAVGIGADYIKAGAPARGERVAKYNRLLKIEEELKYYGQTHFIKTL